MKIPLLTVLLAAGLVQAGVIRLRTGTLDTSAPRPRSMRARAQRATARGTAIYLVQFTGPVRPEWKAQLAATGCVLHGYVPEYAFLVEATPEQLNAAARLACVAWSGEFMPEYKVYEQPEHPAPAGQPARSAIVPGEAVVLLFSEADMADVAAEISAHGGTVVSTGAGALRARFASGSACNAAAAALARLAAVEAVLPALRPHTVNDIATGPTKLRLGNVWTNGTGLTGRGQVIGHADTGLDNGTNDHTIHPDFTNRIKAAIALGRPNDWSDINDVGHGTHTAGSILGNGSASGGQFRGVAYEAQLIHQSTEDAQGYLSGIPDDLRILYRQTYTNSARIHSNSWGVDSEGLNGTYYTWCRDTDEFVWQNPDMTIVYAAGNGAYDRKLCGVIGDDFIILPATAKNIITMGAAENLRTPGTGGATAREYMHTSEAAFRIPPIRHDVYSWPWRQPFGGMVAWSARGPCDDGRIKPDLVAPGSDVVSCRTSMSNFTYWSNLYPGNSNYLFMSGTSMATPLAAGCAAIVRQYLLERRGVTNPSAALVKAMLCAGARSLHPGQYGTGRFLEVPKTRPNNVEGWGMIDMENTVMPPAYFTNVFFDGPALDTGASHVYDVVLSGHHQLCVMLVWSDYKGSTTAAQALVNDLDVVVITPDGVTNYPNALAGPDRTNNVEGVLLPGPPQAGPHRIIVRGHNVPQGPQPYALVVRERLYRPPVAVWPTNIHLYATVGGSAAAVIALSNNATDSTAYDIETQPTWYDVADSTMPGGPQYEWVDISASGVRITNFDTRNAMVILTNGFAFPLCGRTYQFIKVSSYGALSVTNMTIGYESAPYPNRYGAIPKIGVLQDYFVHFAGSARMYWHTNATRLVVSWVNIENGDLGGAPVTFQALLFTNGVMKFQYKTVNATATLEASIGFQGHILSNDPYWCEAGNYFPRPVNNLAVQFTPPPLRWLTPSGDYGLVAPGDVSNITTLAASSDGLTAGVYRCDVKVHHSGPNASPLIVPVTFTVMEPVLAVAETHAVETGGDMDAFIEPGETGALQVVLFNGMSSATTNLAAALAALSPAASVLGGTSAYPGIAPSGLATNDTPFTFAVAPTASNGQPLAFALVCTSGEAVALSGTVTAAVAVRSGIAGTVRDIADGSPVSNATVFWQGGSVQSVAADATGAYRIAALPPGVYAVWAGAPGYAAGSPLMITCPPDVVNADLRIGRPLALCWPAQLEASLAEFESAHVPLTVSNAGAGPLLYALSLRSNLAYGVTWLKLSSAGGTIAPFAATTTAVIFESQMLYTGVYRGAVVLTWEGGAIELPAAMTVVPEGSLLPLLLAYAVCHARCAVYRREKRQRTLGARASGRHGARTHGGTWSPRPFLAHARVPFSGACVSAPHADAGTASLHKQ